MDGIKVWWKVFGWEMWCIILRGVIYNSINISCSMTHVFGQSLLARKIKHYTATYGWNSQAFTKCALEIKLILIGSIKYSPGPICQFDQLTSRNVLATSFWGIIWQLIIWCKLHSSFLLQGGDPAATQRVQARCEAGEGGGHAWDKGGNCGGVKNSFL